MINFLCRIALMLVIVGASSASSTEQRYFPIGALDEMATLDKAISRWYSGQLRALKEPSLYELSKLGTSQSYRFLWLRTWDHPISVRFTLKSDGTGQLVTKMCDGTGGADPGKLVLTRNRELNKDQVESLRLKFEVLDFWSPPTRSHSNGRDGARWIIEGVGVHGYHVVDRWSPSAGPVRELALHLMQLASLEIPSEKLY